MKTNGCSFQLRCLLGYYITKSTKNSQNGCLCHPSANLQQPKFTNIIYTSPYPAFFHTLNRRRPPSFSTLMVSDQHLLCTSDWFLSAVMCLADAGVLIACQEPMTCASVNDERRSTQKVCFSAVITSRLPSVKSVTSDGGVKTTLPLKTYRSDFIMSTNV